LPFHCIPGSNRRSHAALACQSPCRLPAVLSSSSS
jgi:hypothetical protein